MPTLTLGYFNFISIETISDPPLVLPLLNIHPKPIPLKTAPNIQKINLFPQNVGKIFPKRFDVNAIVIIVKALFIQNSLLKYINASIKSGIFIKNKNEPKSFLLRIYPIKLAIPAKPPSPALFGNIKQRQPIANNIMPVKFNAKYFKNRGFIDFALKNPINNPIVIINEDLIDKINELVDAVNKLTDKEDKE